MTAIANKGLDAWPSQPQPPVVTTTTFISPAESPGEFIIWARIQGGWQRYGSAESLEDAKRQARKFHFRLSKSALR